MPASSTRCRTSVRTHGSIAATRRGVIVLFSMRPQPGVPGLIGVDQDQPLALLRLGASTPGIALEKPVVTAQRLGARVEAGDQPAAGVVVIGLLRLFELQVERQLEHRVLLAEGPDAGTGRRKKSGVNRSAAVLGAGRAAMHNLRNRLRRSSVGLSRNGCPAATGVTVRWHDRPSSRCYPAESHEAQRAL